MTNVTEQNKLTEMRIALRKYVYPTVYFQYNFRYILMNSAYMPTISAEYNEYEQTFVLIIDKNRCSDIPGYVHSKEYYAQYIKEYLFQTLSIMSNTQNPTDVNLSQAQVVINNLYRQNVAEYRLIDFTTILENMIIINL